MLNLMRMRMMNEIDELIWQYNKEMALQALENDDVGSYTTPVHRGDYRAK